MSKVGFRCPVCDAVLIVSGRDAPLINGATSSDSSEILSKRIDEINWSKRVGARIIHTLGYEDIVTIADLIKKTEPELLRNPNFGRKSLDEVKQFLAANGLHLGIGDE